MKDLLKADFYRLFRSKFFYILLGVAFIFALFTFSLYMVIAKIAEEEFLGVPFTAEIFQQLSFDGTVAYFTVIAAAIFICGDYSGGGMRNKILIGCGRTNIYRSKLIVMIFVSVCMYLVPQIVVFVCGGLGFGWQGTSAYAVFSRFAAGLLLSVALASLFTAVSILSEKLSLSLVMGIVLMLAVSLITGLLEVGKNYFDSDLYNNFLKVLCWLTPIGQNSLLAGGSDDFWIMGIFSLAWFIASFFAGPALFKNRAVK